jgi:hypothetical protein
MRRPAVLGVSAFLAATAPALAGQVFIPLASNRSIDGQITYRTRVFIANPVAADRQATTNFIEQGADGTVSKAAPSQLQVPGGGSLSLASVAPERKSGMLEIAGGDELVVTARVEAIGPTGEVLSSASVPAVSAANAMPAGSMAHLQGLGRLPGAVTNFALLNLSTQPASCDVSAFRADGGQIAHTVTLAMPPLGTLQFDDAFAALGEQQVAEGRFEATCNQQFYAYATVLQVGGPAADFVEPSQGMSGTLVADRPAPPPGGAVTLNVPGVFLRATQKNSFVSYDLGAAVGVRYNRVAVEFDLTITKFNQTLLFTGVHSVRRPNKNRRDRVLYYALQLVNRNSKTVLDLGVQDVLARTQGPWRTGHTYHLRFTYDVGQRRVQLDVAENGAYIYTIAGPAQHPDLSANQNPITVDFGQTGIGDGAYGPPLGWIYANLNVAMTP